MRTWFVTLLGFIVSFNLLSQSTEEVFKNAKIGLNEKETYLLNKARLEYTSELFKEAILYIDSIKQKDQLYLDYIKGVLYAHDDRTRTKALKYIYKAEAEISHIEDYHFNKAFAQSRVDSFEHAMDSYKIALGLEEAKKHKNKKLIDEIHVRIEQCHNILAMKDKKNLVTVKNIGPPINTDFLEYCPIITSNDNIMIYTYRGPKSSGGKQNLESNGLHKKRLDIYFEDIFVSKKLNDTLWSQPSVIPNLVTKTHDAAVCVNSDGTEMFVYENIGKGKGDLYLSKLIGNTWTKPIRQTHLNSREWDGSACFIPNQNKIIISSERKGGYGGKDLYYAERIKDGVWGNITNLGPLINSKYDEDAPFVTVDGKILFFSTNNESSIGGYDIERSDLVNGFWSKPYNLGPPINTVDDDEYFTVRADGKVAYYSSGKADGKGGQDIYVVKPGIPGKPVALLQVDGLVTLDGKPVPAEIELRSMIKDPTHDFLIKANEITGRFLCNLTANDEYELTVHIDKFPPQVISLTTTEIDTFIVMNVFAEFYSAGNGVDDDNVKEENTPSTTSGKDTAIVALAKFDKNFPAAKDSSLVQKFGRFKQENIKYKVQIGAFRFPKNFNYNNFIGQPKIVMQKDADDISHFSTGEYDTYEEAKKLLENIRPFTPGAFIVVYNNDKRLSLQGYWQSLAK